MCDHLEMQTLLHQYGIDSRVVGIIREVNGVVEYGGIPDVITSDDDMWEVF